MTADRRPLPDELDALREIISGKAADPQTMQKLVTCNLVEEFDGTALLTARGIEAAALLSCPAKPRGKLLCNASTALAAKPGFLPGVTTTPTVMAWADGQFVGDDHEEKLLNGSE
jgi:hypothetical protein